MPEPEHTPNPLDAVLARFREEQQKHDRKAIEQFEDLTPDAPAAAAPTEAEPAADLWPAEAPKRAKPAAAQRPLEGVLKLRRNPDTGRVYNTIENFVSLLRYHNIEITTDRLRKMLDIKIPGQDIKGAMRLDALSTLIVSKAIEAGFPQGNVDRYIAAVATKNQHHPVHDWILSADWDGVDRIRGLIDTVETTADSGLRDVLVRKWLIGAVACVMDPNGTSLSGVLTFQGAQGSGKTMWVRSLAPRDFVADGVNLDTKNKDSVLATIRNWIVELGELDATFRKSDIAALKSFLVQEVDTLRRSYGHFEGEYPRQTTFVATVNEPEFLQDGTGNRRFWVLPNAKLNWRHNIDMQQLWAQVYADHYLMGDSWHLDEAELAALNESNLSSTTTGLGGPMDDPWYDVLAEAAVERAGTRATMKDILHTDLMIPMAQQERKYTQRAARILRHLGCEKLHTKHGKLWAYPTAVGDPTSGD